VSVGKIRLAIVVAEFNYDITYLMLQKALEHAKFLGAEVTYVAKVPGTYDMPIVVNELLKKEDVDAVAAIGAVIQGETKHDEVGGPPNSQEVDGFIRGLRKTSGYGDNRTRSK